MPGGDCCAGVIHRLGFAKNAAQLITNKVGLLAVLPPS